MLNNLTNFFNLITGRRIKTQLENDDLIAIGTKQSPSLGDYKPTAIKYEDLKKSISVAWGNITGTLSTQTDLQNALNAKQNTLVSGTNIKTINGNSVLGSGNLAISGSSDTKFKSISSINGATVTGIVGVGISSSVFIPSGTLDNNTIIDVLVASRRQSGSGTVQIQIYLNNTNSLTGATLMATGLNFTSNNWNGKLIRSFFVSGNTLVTNALPTSLLNIDLSTPASPTSYSYDPTTTNLYIIFAMNNLSTDNVSFTNGHKVLCY